MTTTAVLDDDEPRWRGWREATAELDACTITPDCQWGRHEAADHPCGKRHTPGSPCAYCGKATPIDGSACPDCWTPITIPMAKAMFAEHGLSVDPRPMELR